MSHVRGSGYQSISRLCAECDHPELKHFPQCFECECSRFAARKLTEAEKTAQAQADQERQEEFKWSGDPYSEFREHLADIMRRASE